MHTHASWDGEQCCRRKFSFSSHQKTIFYISSIKNGRFCEATTKWLIQNTTTTFYKNTMPPYTDNVPTGDPKPFRPPLVKKKNSAESVGSGSDMNYKYMIRCSWFFTKIIFRFTICYF